MRRSLLILPLLVLAGCPPPVFVRSEPAARGTLPAWTPSSSVHVHALEPGDSVRWRLAVRAARRDGSEPAEWPEVATAALPVQAGVAVAIEARSDGGVPVLMVTDRPLHPLDPLSYSSRERDPAAPLPGHPVAWAMGDAGGAASLRIAPEQDAVLQLHAWVLTGSLRPPEPFDDGEEGLAELPPEMREMYAPMMELARAASVEPDLCRAWNPRGGDVEDGGSGRHNLTIDVSEAAGGQAPRGLLELWAADHPDSLTDAPQRAAWSEAVVALASGRAGGLAQARTWAQRGLELDLTHGYRVEQLRGAAQHPTLRGVLIGRARELEAWGDRQLGLSWLRSERTLAGGEAAVLQSRASDELARMLPGLGGTSAALVAFDGTVLAATEPFVRPELSGQDTWSALDADEIVATEAYELPGIPGTLKRAAVPVRDGDLLLGWLLLELAGGS